MIVFKETVDDEKFLEILLTLKEARSLDKLGSLYSKQLIDGDVVNVGIRIDDIEYSSYSKI